jgi:hypothetical protein
MAGNRSKADTFRRAGDVDLLLRLWSYRAQRLNT